MTLALAMVCGNGLIVAADSAATFAEGVKQPTVKIREFGKQMLWASAGHEGMIQEIEAALTHGRTPESYFKSLMHFRQQVRKVLSPVYKEWAETQVRIPQPPYHQFEIAHLLFVGYLSGKPCIVEVEPNCVLGQLEDYGHAVIGSASLIAQALLYTHRRRVPDLDVGKVICYRVMKDAIAIAPGGVAEPIHLWAIEQPTTPQTTPKMYQVLDKDLEEVNYGIQSWREGEEELLTLIGHATAEE